MSDPTGQISPSSLDAGTVTSQIQPPSAGSTVIAPAVDHAASPPLQRLSASASATVVRQRDFTEPGLLPAACACGGDSALRNWSMRSASSVTTSARKPDAIVLSKTCKAFG